MHVFSVGRRWSRLMFLTTASQRIASLPCCCRSAATSLLTVSVLLARSWCCSNSRPFMCGNSASSMEGPVIVPARASHTASLIFLHGLGDTGHGWAAGFEDVVKSAGLQHIKIICPTAPIIPVTLNMRFEMPAWFDITSLSFNEEQDEERIKASSQMLTSLIEEEEKSGIPSNRIIIGGFSQGGAIALYTALTTERQFGGVLALSTWLPLHTKFPAAFVGSKREYPVFQAHGNADPVVNFTYGNATCELLKKYCKDHTFKTYSGMGHSSCPEEMKDIKNFVTKVLPGVTAKN